jgi:hypothetical protein
MGATQSVVSDSDRRIDTCCSSRGWETCDGRSEQKYSGDNGENRAVAQTALGPTMDGIASGLPAILRQSATSFKLRFRRRQVTEKMVTLISSRWSQTARWLRQLDAVLSAA